MIQLNNKKITVMGLGLHGGGLAAARYCCEQGAIVTVTDIQSSEKLHSSVEALREYPVKLVLGEHNEEDFIGADIVIKNPAVPRDNKYLKLAKSIETDISIFLQRFTGTVICVTGSKGKSTTASAIHHGLSQQGGSWLGGNITTSPLSFIENIKDGEKVVLELSSFQLGDLTLTKSWREGWRISPEIAVLTNIMEDHQDYYGNMQDYIADKQILFKYQSYQQSCILPGEKGVYNEFFKNSKAKKILLDSFEEYLAKNLLPANPIYKGPRQNLAAAATALFAIGINPESVPNLLTTFSGIPHRMELIGEKNGIQFINDTAATIPKAVETSIMGMDGNIILIAGGVDKKLDLSPFIMVGKKCESVILLDGSAGQSLVKLFKKHSIKHGGPYDSLESAFEAAIQEAATSNKPATVILSPGAASFNMFKNEFDRGNQFRNLAEKWLA